VRETDAVFSVVPIGRVACPRSEVIDDDWGEIVSRVTLDDEVGARRPGGDPEWPSVGIFAQRNKRRPNRIGVCTCELLEVHCTELTIRGLDAIDGSPVLDLKPYMTEFALRGPARQPSWLHELMSGYWS
jgi:tRNA (adenine37-N6)-methyltransferase